MTEKSQVKDPLDDIGPITRMNSAKGWMENNKIPQMFESFVAALMLERPDNLYEYLDEKVEAVKAVGIENISWETFILDLHPHRDPVRQRLIGEETQPVNETFKEEEDHIEADYDPLVFQLTETKQ